MTLVRLVPHDVRFLNCYAPKYFVDNIQSRQVISKEPALQRITVADNADLLLFCESRTYGFRLRSGERHPSTLGCGRPGVRHPVLKRHHMPGPPRRNSPCYSDAPGVVKATERDRPASMWVRINLESTEIERPTSMTPDVNAQQRQNAKTAAQMRRCSPTTPPLSSQQVRRQRLCLADVSW